MRAAGVDVSRVRWSDPHSGARTGLNFVERGFGVRGALGVSDRAGSAASGAANGSAGTRTASSPIAAITRGAVAIRARRTLRMGRLLVG